MTSSEEYESGDRQIDLSELTWEVGKWAEENFGDQYDIQHSITERSRSAVQQDDVDIGAIFCTLGVNEEAGELTHSVLKRAQGIRGDEEDVGPEAEMDAVGDIVVYLADFCHRRGYDLEECVQRAWDGEVSDREWDSATRADGGDEDVGQ